MRYIWASIIVLLCRVSEATERPSEYQMKAVFLYKFARFVEWPAKAFADSTSPIIIGLLGKDPFGEMIDRAIRDKIVQGRTVQIQRFKKIEDLQPCHILFVGEASHNVIPALFDHLKGASTLTVGDREGFVEKGGMIQFSIDKEKLHFQINATTAESMGLRISSQLLKLAQPEREDRERY